MSEAASAAPAGAPAAPAAGTPGAAAPGAEEISSVAIGEGQPAAAPAAPEAKSDASAPISYEKTGDIGLDLALEFVGTRGFGPDSAEMVAAMRGDFSLLRAKLGAMGDKAAGYENMLALAEKSHKEGAEAAKAKATKDAELIHNAVGGKDAWANISKWAGENAEPSEKESINAALKGGGFAAKLVAQALAERYNRATGTVVEPAAVASKDAAGKADPLAPLGVQEFAKESQKLRQQLGVNFEKSSQYATLVSRRTAGRRAGK